MDVNESRLWGPTAGWQQAALVATLDGESQSLGCHGQLQPTAGAHVWGPQTDAVSIGL